MNFLKKATLPLLFTLSLLYIYYLHSVPQQPERTAIIQTRQPTIIPSATPCPTYTEVQGGQWIDSNSGLLWTTEEMERNKRYECN